MDTTMVAEAVEPIDYGGICERVKPNHVALTLDEPKIFKDECMYCYNTPYYSGGLYVCLKTYCAFCPRHLIEYATRNDCVAFLQVLSRKVFPEKTVEPEQKICKLAVGVEGGFNNEKFEIVDEYYFVAYPDLNVQIPVSVEIRGDIYAACNKVINTTSAERLEMLQNASNAWDGELKKPTKHADLKQLGNGKLIPYKGWKCEEPGCGLNENLWLNLTDGAIRCGRSQFIGDGQKSKGNNHMKLYYDATGFPLVVKLGTVENGSADVFSYDEDDAVIDPNLKHHLAHFGLDIDCLEKTEKSTLELELDMNQKWEWSKIQEDGANLENAYGPGLTGLINIGSSCYMNSVIQAFLLVPDFCQRFGGASAMATLQALPPTDIYKDFNAQLSRLVNSMLEGAYSLPDGLHNGIKPSQLKRIVGAGHPEFGTAKQQDAEEYVRYLIEQITKHTPPGELDPTLAVKFNKEERLQTVNSDSVRYTVHEETLLTLPVPKELMKKIPDQENRYSVSFEKCIAHAFAPEGIDNRFIKSIRFKTFPDFLIVQLQRFTVDEATYQQKKLDVDVLVPDTLDLAQYRARGIQPGEIPMTDDEHVPPAPKLEVDQNIVAQIEAMGFTRNAALKASLETKNGGIEAATEWIMVHIDDPSLNDPPEQTMRDFYANAPGTSVDNESVLMLEGFGFTKHQARYGLHKFNFDANMAAEWLFTHVHEVPDEVPTADRKGTAEVTKRSATPTEMRDGREQYRLVGFISHMGSSPHSGHYVAHLLHNDRWVLFNDEKVAYSQNPPKQLAYLYIYKRQ